MTKRNKLTARAGRSGVPPYTGARRMGQPKVPCKHCQEVTRESRRHGGQDLTAPMDKRENVR
jgi:hypothetical protein